MSFLSSLGFFTTIPVPRRFQDNVGGSLVYLPIIGVIIGLILAGLSYLLDFLVPPPLAAGLCIAALVGLTGALHLDGFLDTCDGFARHGSIEERWAAMVDSRAGGLGVVGVVCLLLLKFVSLAALSESMKPIALLLMPLLGRWGMAYSIFAFPYAKLQGVGKSFKETSSWRDLAISTGICLIAVLLLLGLTGMVIMFWIWILVLLVGSLLKKTFGGLTGDNYGAICELMEVTTLIAFATISYGGC